MADKESILLEHLEFLYGSQAEHVLDGLLRLMRSYEGRISSQSTKGLDQRDVVLITYGDMVSEPGRAPLATLAEFLHELVGDVVNTVHVLPFYPYSSDDGFSVVDYYAVDETLGTWDDIEVLGGRFRTMFDAVVNHVSAQSEWFQEFRAGNPDYADFFTIIDPDVDLSAVFRPRDLPLLTEFETSAGPQHLWTTFSDDQIDLNYRNPDVLLAVVSVLLEYVARGASLIRLDAIAFLWKEVGTTCLHLPGTHHTIKLLRAVLDHIAPETILITETNVPHKENISYFGDGADEAHLVYNFALPPLVLHAFHTGNAEVLSEWAERLDSPSDSCGYFNFLASHDGIGLGGARGILSEVEIADMAERVEKLGGGVSYRAVQGGSPVPYELNVNYLDALADPVAVEDDGLVARRFLTTQAIMLALRGVPGVYFHSLFGSRGWHEGVAETGRLRTVNRQKLDRKRLELEIEAGLRAAVFGGYRRLLSARAAHDAFDPAAPQSIVSIHPSVFAVMRFGTEGSVLCLHNVGGSPVAVSLHDLIASPVDLIEGGILGGTIELAPFATAWIAGELP